MTLNDEPESDLKKNPHGFDFSTQEKHIMIAALIFVFFFFGILIGRYWLGGGN